MPGSFFEVVGGNIANIGRHGYFRSPGLPGIVGGGNSTSVNFLQRPKPSNATAVHIFHCQ
jgi:hypothetical protein